MDLQTQNISDKIDLFEAKMLENSYPVDCPLKHTFLPGLYIREIFMPAGTIVTSLIHKTNHPYFVLTGKVSVFSENDRIQHIAAPYRGITKPGTRRVLHVLEDTTWITCHPTDVQPVDDSAEAIEEAVEMIGKEILEEHINPLLGGVVKNNFITHKISNQ